MTNGFLSKIAEKCGLIIKRQLPLESGYRNKIYPFTTIDGKSYCLVLYKNEAGIKDLIRRVNEISGFLAARGLNVRVVVGMKKRKIIKINFRKTERFACIYNYLSGETIPWEAYTMKHIKLLGKTMSDMHYQLGDYPKTHELPLVCTTVNKQLNEMEKYFQKSGVKKAMQNKLQLQIEKGIFGKLRKFLLIVDQVEKKYPEDISPLHMDFVRSNVLFSEGQNTADKKRELVISGILDFEKVAQGLPVVDVARTLAFLIVDCKYKSEQKVRKYFLTSGYQKRGQIQLKHQKLLEPLMQFFWLYDFYKFLLHNPYESLLENEHYLRTLVLLVRQQMVLEYN